MTDTTSQKHSRSILEPPAWALVLLGAVACSAFAWFAFWFFFPNLIQDQPVITLQILGSTTLLGLWIWGRMTWESRKTQRMLDDTGRADGTL